MGRFQDIKIPWEISCRLCTANVTVHVHNSTCRVHVQGATTLFGKSPSHTAASWVVRVFVIQSLRDFINKNHISDDSIDKLNGLISSEQFSAEVLDKVHNSLGTAREATEKSNLCALCRKCFKGNSKKKVCKCNAILHTTCLSKP